MSEQPKQRRIRVTHDGSLYAWKGSSVKDVESGEQLHHVRRVEVVLDGRHAPTAVVYVDGPEMDLEIADAEIRPTLDLAEERIAMAVTARILDVLKAQGVIKGL